MSKHKHVIWKIDYLTRSMTIQEFVYMLSRSMHVQYECLETFYPKYSLN